jgi:hypothetical protein
VKRKRGTPSLRARYVRRVAKLAPPATAVAWAHLGIAAGIDAPVSGDAFRRVAEDYRRLLRAAR